MQQLYPYRKLISFLITIIFPLEIGTQGQLPQLKRATELWKQWEVAITWYIRMRELSLIYQKLTETLVLDHNIFMKFLKVKY